MATLTPLVSSLDTLLSAHSFDRQLSLLILLALFFGTHLTKFAFPHISTRFKTLSSSRKTQLAVTVPMLILRVSIGLLIAFHLPPSSPFSRIQQLPTQTAEGQELQLLHQQFNLYYILCLGYLFELLYRPSPPELDTHHVFCMMAAGYFWFKSHAQMSAQEQRNLVDLFGIPSVIISFGIPPVDFASDIIRILYHCYAPNLFTLGLFKTFISMAWAGRILQWSMMVEFLVRRGPSLYKMSGVWECGGGAALITYYIWMEYMELDHFRRLTGKYKARKGIGSGFGLEKGRP